MSKLFTPPQDNVPDNDPAVVRVPLDKMNWAARMSQQKSWDNSGAKRVANIPNGK